MQVDFHKQKEMSKILYNNPHNLPKKKKKKKNKQKKNLLNPPFSLPNLSEHDQLYRLNIFNENLQEIENQKRQLEAMSIDPFCLHGKPTTTFNSSGNEMFNHGNNNNFRSKMDTNQYDKIEGNTGLINDPSFRNQLQGFLSKNHESLPIIKGEKYNNNNPGSQAQLHLQNQFKNMKNMM